MENENLGKVFLSTLTIPHSRGGVPTAIRRRARLTCNLSHWTWNFFVILAFVNNQQLKILSRRYTHFEKGRRESSLSLALVHSVEAGCARTWLWWLLLTWFVSSPLDIGPLPSLLPPLPPPTHTKSSLCFVLAYFPLTNHTKANSICPRKIQKCSEALGDTSSSWQPAVGFKSLEDLTFSFLQSFHRYFRYLESTKGWLL